MKDYLGDLWLVAQTVWMALFFVGLAALGLGMGGVHAFGWWFPIAVCVLACVLLVVVVHAILICVGPPSP